MILFSLNSVRIVMDDNAAFSHAVSVSEDR